MKTLMVLILILSLLFVAGCETTRGLGKDIEKAGQWMQEKVN